MDGVDRMIELDDIDRALLRILREQPRTPIAESCGNLQYRSSGVSIVVVSAGDRHEDGGRNPTVHAGGSSTEIRKSPSGMPVALFCPTADW